MPAHQHQTRTARVIHRAAQRRAGTFVLTAIGIAWYIGWFFA